jgi:hypothetical protein
VKSKGGDILEFAAKLASSSTKLKKKEKKQPKYNEQPSRRSSSPVVIDLDEVEDIDLDEEDTEREKQREKHNKKEQKKKQMKEKASKTSKLQLSFMPELLLKGETEAESLKRQEKAHVARMDRESRRGTATTPRKRKLNIPYESPP